jgi:hypothetical protein
MSKLHEIQHDLSFDRFRLLMDRYTAFVAQAGKFVRRAPPEKTEEIFHSADPAQRERMITRLETEISIFEDTLGAGEALENGSRQLWRYLLKRRLVPCSDMFDKISKDDTIQVYGTDLKLQFASLNFFDHVSFTLEQIFSETWQSAVTRDAKVSEGLYVEFTRLFSGEIRHSLNSNSPVHLIEEVDTESLLKSHLRVKWMSPVFLNDKVDSIISVVEVINI